MNGFDPLSEQELIELDDFLSSQSAPDNAMTLDGLDGFLTALVIGPVTVMPSEWLPFVLGTEKGDEPLFASPEQAEALMQLLMRYFNSLVVTFRDDPEGYAPVFDYCTYACEEDEDAAVNAWALAFVFGIEHCYDAWKPIFDLVDDSDDEASMILAPILLLAGQDADEHELSGIERSQLQSLVAESVSYIYNFWLPYRGTTQQPLPVSKKSRIIPIDHNSTCPCGSGKSYKNCCENSNR